MAASFGTKTTSSLASFSHVVDANSQITVIGVTIFDNSGSVGTLSATIDGNAMTEIVNTTGGSASYRVALFYRVGVASGARTVALTYSGTRTKSSTYAVDLWGSIDTASPIGATLGNSVSPYSAQTLNPGARVGAIIDVAVFENNGGAGLTFTPNFGTQAFDVDTGGTSGPNEIYQEGRYGASTLLTTTVGWSASGGVSNGYTYAIAEIKTTTVDVPIMSTEPITDLRDTSVTGNGTILHDGGASDTARGFVVSTSSHADPGNVAPASTSYALAFTDSGSYSAGAFTKSLTGLAANTTYFYRSYAQNSAGYAYGDEETFATWPDDASMFDAVSINNASGSSAGSTPHTHTTGADANFMLCAVFIDSGASTVSTTLFNGVALTQLYTDIADAATRIWVGYLVNPDAGAHNLAVNFNGGTPTPYRVVCLTVKNVNTGSPIGGDVSAKFVNSTTTSETITPNVVAPKGIVVGFMHGTRVSSGVVNHNLLETLTGTWGGGVNHLGAAMFGAHIGSNILMTFSSLVIDTSASDQIAFAVEIKRGGFIPQIAIT